MSQLMWSYTTTERVILGTPAGVALIEEAKRTECERLFIVTSASVSRSDFLGRVIDELGGLYAGQFSQVTAHGPTVCAIDAARAAREARADKVVAIGGGTAIDIAKVVTICLHFGIDDLDALNAWRGFTTGRDPSHKPADASEWIRLAAVPTTLSAAEFTWWGGALDTTTMTKHPYAHQMSVPQAIILDPAATVSSPETLFLSSGIKSLDHAAERLTSTRRDALSDARAIHAIQLLVPALRQVRENPTDLEARLATQTATAISMASPLTGVGVGASHALGHALGGHAGVQHGLTSCVTLAPVMRWNLDCNANRQKLISAAMGAPDQPAGDLIEGLVRELGLPYRLRDLGVSHDDLPAIAEKVMDDHSIGNNIRQPKSIADVVELLEMTW